MIECANFPPLFCRFCKLQKPLCLCPEEEQRKGGKKIALERNKSRANQQREKLLLYNKKVFILSFIHSAIHPLVWFKAGKSLIENGIFFIMLLESSRWKQQLLSPSKLPSFLSFLLCFTRSE